MSGNARERGRSTVNRLLTLLDVFADGDFTLAEVAERSRLPLSTARRMLTELEQWQGVHRTKTGRYRIGLHLWELGTRSSVATRLRDIALPSMQNLYEATHENVQLAVLDHRSALVIERLTGTKAVPTVTAVGGRLPLHATGVGKVLLAHADPELMRAVIAAGLTRFTPYTLIMPARLVAALRTTRASGLATCNEEMTLGAVSVAVPITDASGMVLAALSIVTHSTRTPTKHKGALTAAAREISLRLGRPPQSAPLSLRAAEDSVTTPLPVAAAVPTR